MAYEKELAVAAMLMRGLGSRVLYHQFLPRIATSIALLAFAGVLAGILFIIVIVGTYFAVLHAHDAMTAGYVLACLMAIIAAFSAGFIAYTFRRISQPLIKRPIQSSTLDTLTSFWEGLTEGMNI